MCPQRHQAFGKPPKVADSLALKGQCFQKQCRAMEREIRCGLGVISVAELSFTLRKGQMEGQKDLTVPRCVSPTGPLLLSLQSRLLASFLSTQGLELRKPRICLIICNIMCFTYIQTMPISSGKSSCHGLLSFSSQRSPSPLQSLPQSHLPHNPCWSATSRLHYVCSTH